MSGERMMILKMLSEGKITLEEADDLLAALGSEEEKLFLAKEEAQGNSKDVCSKDINKSKSSIDHDEYYEDEDEEEILSLLEDKLDRIDDELDRLEDRLEDEMDRLEDHLDEISEMDNLNERERLELEQKVQDTYKKLDERREKIRERRKELKNKRKEYHKQFKNQHGQEKGISFDFQEAIDEVTRHFQEFKDNFNKETMDDIKATMKEIAGQIKDGMKELRHGLNEGSREFQKAFQKTDFKKMFNNLFKSIGIHSRIKIDKTLEGSFDPEQGGIVVDLKTSNGRIEIFGTDEPGYRLNLHYQIAAENEAEAEEIIKDMTTIEQSPNLLKFETHFNGQGSVSVQLYIPRTLDIEYRLKSSNGKIITQGLKNNGTLDISSSNGQLGIYDMRVKELNGHTSNGRIEVKDFASDVVDVGTSNGSIYLDGLCDKISCNTSNGTITVNPYITENGLLDLKTSNGRIKIMVKDPETAVDIYARTSMGSVVFDIPKLVFETKVEKNMKKEYQAHTENYIEQVKRLQIRAVTSMGSIYIGTLAKPSDPTSEDKDESEEFIVRE